MKFTSILSEPFSTLDTLEQLQVTAFYLTIVLATLIIITGIILKKLKPESISDYIKGVKGFIFGYAVALTGIILTLKVSESVADGSFVPALFYPILSIFVTLIFLLLIGLLINIKNPQFLPKYKLIALFVGLIPIIVSIVMIALHYKTVESYYEDVSQVGLYISAIVLVTILIVFALVISRRSSGFNTFELAYAGITIALAFALSNVKFFKLPQGGSITLASMFPIMLFSYMYGMKKSIFVAFIYGILQAVIDPYIIHPAQFFLDYPIAFGMLGLAGLFREFNIIKKPLPSFIAGAVLAGTMRYISHVLSGIFAFASYVGEGYSTVAWGFLYNTFTLADTAIVILFGILLLSNKSFLRLINEKSTDFSVDNASQT